MLSHQKLAPFIRERMVREKGDDASMEGTWQRTSEDRLSRLRTFLSYQGSIKPSIWAISAVLSSVRLPLHSWHRNMEIKGVNASIKGFHYTLYTIIVSYNNMTTLTVSQQGITWRAVKTGSCLWAICLLTCSVQQVDPLRGPSDLWPSGKALLVTLIAMFAVRDLMNWYNYLKPEILNHSYTDVILSGHLELQSWWLFLY